MTEHAENSTPPAEDLTGLPEASLAAVQVFVDTALALQRTQEELEVARALLAHRERLLIRLADAGLESSWAHTAGVLKELTDWADYQPAQ